VLGDNSMSETESCGPMSAAAAVIGVRSPTNLRYAHPDFTMVFTTPALTLILQADFQSTSISFRDAGYQSGGTHDEVIMLAAPSGFVAAWPGGRDLKSVVIRAVSRQAIRPFSQRRRSRESDAWFKKTVDLAHSGGDHTIDIERCLILHNR
jgi:hypothetical protein